MSNTSKPALMVPTNRPPTTAATMLIEDFLNPLGISRHEFAEHIGIPFRELRQILYGVHPVTVDIANRFARACGNSPQFWLNAQLVVDACDDAHKDRKPIEDIVRLQAESSDKP